MPFRPAGDSHRQPPHRDTAAAPPVIETRARILNVGVGWVEDLRRSYPTPEKEPERHCPDFKIVFPYSGLFVWHVGKDNVVGDGNQILFVRGDEAFRISSRSTRGSGEMIVTPDIEVLSEMTCAAERALFDHPLFKRRVIRATPRLQVARTHFLNWLLSRSPRETIEAEEALLALLRASIRQSDAPPRPATGATARLVRRAKEILNERFTEPLRLPEVARNVGASPTYLTDLFTKTEGISLHQYLTQLRLSHALAELIHANDLAALALELGFSSHSHFTYAFRRSFGCTPSVFRELTRRAAAASFECRSLASAQARQRACRGR